jgi:lipopolysaccharide transport system permease protein
MVNGPAARSHEVRIRANRSWFRIDWRALVEFRDLLVLLVRRNFVVRYKQTVLGPAWFILGPVLTTLVFTVVFGRIAGIPTDGLPPVLFYLCGLVGWNYFAGTMQESASTFVANASLFGKVYFPRLIVPLTAAVSNLFAVALQVGTLAAFWLYFRLATPAGADLRVGPELIVIPLLLLHAAALALGVGLWIASCTAKYRDLAHVTPLLIQLWMYGTPVIYPLSAAREHYFWLVALNPMTPIVEAFRYALLGQGIVEPAYYGLSVAVSAVALLSGIMVFQKTERTFIDTV